MSEDVQQLVVLLARGFFRTGLEAASAELDEQEDGATAILTVTAPGMASAVVILLARFLIQTHSPTAMPEMRPDTALERLDIDVSGATGAPLAVEDRLIWPHDDGVMPRIEPASDVIQTRRATVSLSGAELDLGSDFLDAVAQFASYGAFVPLERDTANIDNSDCEIWLGRSTTNDTSVLNLEEVAMEATALAAVVKALASRHDGPIAVRSED